jgi:hypothetical protein
VTVHEEGTRLPTRTGDERYDAFIAGVVETRLETEALPHPKWLATVPALTEPWFVDEWTAGSERVESATPPELGRRRVLIDAAELTSIHVG